MFVNCLFKRKMTFFIWTLGLCWEAEVANSGNTSNNHLRDTEHQPNRAMRLLFSNAYPPAQIQECRSSKEQKKKKYIRKIYDFIQQGKQAEKRKLEQAAMSKLIEMAYKKQRSPTNICSKIDMDFMVQVEKLLSVIQLLEDVGLPTHMKDLGLDREVNKMQYIFSGKKSRRMSNRRISTWRQLTLTYINKKPHWRWRDNTFSLVYPASLMDFLFSVLRISALSQYREP